MGDGRGYQQHIVERRGLLPRGAVARCLRRQALAGLLTGSVLALTSGCYMEVGKDGSNSSSSSSGTGSGGTVSGGGGTSSEQETAVGKVLVKGIAGLMALEIFVVLVAFGVDTDSAAGVALGFFDAVALGLVPTVDPDKPLDLAPVMAEYAVRALGKATITLPDGVTKEQVIAGIITGLFQGVGKHAAYGLSAADETTLLATFAGSATNGVDDAGVTDKAAAVAAITKAMITHLVDAGISATGAAGQYASLMSAVVGGLKNANITDTAAIGDALSQATRAAVAALPAGGITDTALQDAAVLSLTKGATDGLKLTGLAATDQADVSNQIAAGAAQGMVDAGFSQTRIDAAKTTLSAQISGTLTANGVTEQDAATAASAAAAAIGKFSQKSGN